MPAYERLRGLVAQSMGGLKSVPTEMAPYLIPGTYAFVAPIAGYYKFVAWGSGGSGDISNPGAGAGSGAYIEYTRAMGAGETATIVVAPCSPNNAADGFDTTLTFADGKVVTAGGGKGSSTTRAGGVATGGDVNLNGSAGGTNAGTAGTAGLGTGGGAGGAPNGMSVSGGGGGAPANLPYRGAAGRSNGSVSQNVVPGFGAGGCGSNVGASVIGGAGAVLVQLVRAYA